MKILITGGAGFLGLHLATFLTKKQAKVTLVDIADFEKSEYPGECRLVRGDVRAGRLMDKLSRGQDVVIHAAAALPLWKPAEIFEINVGGTKNLLRAAVANKVKRFIFISSTAVYGVPERHPIFEDDPLIGVGPYGESKIQAEKLCEKYRKKGLVVSIVRPKTFVGTHRLGVFEILFDWIRDGKKIPVVGSGNNRYQLLDVDDLVSAIYRLMLLQDKKKANQTFNIGAEKFGTVKEDLGELFDYAYLQNFKNQLVIPAKAGIQKNYIDSRFHGNNNVFRISLKKSKILPTPAFLVKRALWLFEKLRLSPLYQWVYDTADKDSYVSIDRLIDTLKWRPKYSNAEVLIKSYQWYLDNYNEIKSQPAGITHRVGWDQGVLRIFKKIL